MRLKSLSLVMYFNNFRPLAIGRSTSERIISISGPSAFSAPTTCLGDLTEVTAKQKSSVFRIKKFKYDNTHISIAIILWPSLNTLV